MGAMRSVGVRLRLYVDKYAQDAEKAKKRTEDVGKGAKKTKKDFDDLAYGMGLAGAAFAGIATIAVMSTMKFDKQMSEVGAVADATGEQLGDLRQAALDAGAATVYSATEAAQAEAELAKAGVSVSDILGGGLTGALSLAAAGSLDLADAATVAAKAMNIFHLEGKDVGHIADVLAAAANKSATDVGELSQALAMGGAAAANNNISLEETVGTLAAFADNALAGSDGGTSFKTMLQMLAAPSKQASDMMKDLGINAYDAAGNFVGLAALAGQLHDKLGPLTQEQRNHALAVIFGNDAMRAASALYNEGEQGIRDYTAAVDDQGAAARVAAAKMDNLAGDVEALKGSLETAFIEGGSGATSGLRSLVKAANDAVDIFGNLPDPVKTAGVEISAVAGAALLVGSAMIKMGPKVAAGATSLRTLGAAGAVAATGLEGVAAAAGPIALALTGAELSYSHWAERMKDPKPLSNLEKIVYVLTTSPIGMAIFNEMMNDTGPAVLKVRDATESAADKQAQLNREQLAGVDAGEQLIDVWNTLHGAMKSQDEQMLDVLESLDKVKQSFKDNGNAIDGDSEAALRNRVALEDMAQQAYEAADAIITNGGSAEQAQAKLDEWKTAMVNAAVAAGVSREAAQQLADELFRMPAAKHVDVTVGIKVPRGSQAFLSQHGYLPVYGQGVTEYRFGGITAAATGRVMQAGIASSPTVLFGERATEQEAFIPKRGNYGRSMGILQTAAGWMGADVVPRGGYTSGAGAVEVHNHITVSPGSGLGGAIVDGLRFDVSQVGAGNVQSQYGRRGRNH